MLRSSLCKLRKMLSRSFNTPPTPQPKYLLKRPWHFNEEDYSQLADQVSMVNNTEDIKILLEENYGDLNEVHVGFILQNMFYNYIDFSQGKF